MPREKLTKKDLETYMKHHYGEGILSDVGSWIKTKAKEAHNYVKDNKLITKGLRTYAKANPNSITGQLAGIASIGTDYIGYGEKVKPIKKTATKKRGGARTKLEVGLLP